MKTDRKKRIKELLTNYHYKIKSYNERYAELEKELEVLNNE